MSDRGRLLRYCTAHDYGDPGFDPEDCVDCVFSGDETVDSMRRERDEARALACALEAEVARRDEALRCAEEVVAAARQLDEVLSDAAPLVVQGERFTERVRRLRAALRALEEGDTLRLREWAPGVFPGYTGREALDRELAERSR